MSTLEGSSLPRFYVVFAVHFKIYPTLGRLCSSKDLFKITFKVEALKIASEVISIQRLLDLAVANGRL